MRRGVAEGKRLAKVLEIGFGEGAGLHWILDYMQVDPSMVTGIELFEDYVDDARKRWPDARFELVGPTFGGFLDWMEKEREKGEYYELIFARHVLQGNPNAPAFLRAVAGLLPENQLFTFIVPFKGKMYHYEPMDEVGMGWEGTPNEAAVRHKIAEHHATNIPITGFKWLPGSIGPELMKAKLRPVDHGERNACNSPRITESIAYCRRLP